MRTTLFSQLLAIARREGGRNNAEDMVQEALLIAIEGGRHDLADPANAAFLRGVVRNRARMAFRAARRRLVREHAWQATRPPSPPPDDTSLVEILADLPPALKSLAALVLTGHNRREIAYLLDLPDSALRQRVSALKRHLTTRGLVAPQELSGLNLDLAYGRIRDALLPALQRHGGIFASHDPDGHLFIVRRSQKPEPRQ
jgi:DNA-directed RNA polymerase specialized sigma24 family protein